MVFELWTLDFGHLVLLSALAEGRDLEAEKALATTLPGIHVKHHHHHHRHHEAVQFAGIVYIVYIAYFTTEKRLLQSPKKVLLFRFLIVTFNLLKVTLRMHFTGTAKAMVGSFTLRSPLGSKM